MNDKQQIEEINDIISEEYNNGCDNWYAIANELYEQGYRKLPENAVVLTKEEFWKLSNKFSKKELDEIVEFHKNKTRKETAREFAKKVKEIGAIKALLEMKSMPILFGTIYNDIIKGIEELAKQYGVEIKE